MAARLVPKQNPSFTTSESPSHNVSLALLSLNMWKTVKHTFLARSKPYAVIMSIWRRVREAGKNVTTVHRLPSRSPTGQESRTFQASPTLTLRWPIFIWLASFPSSHSALLCWLLGTVLILPFTNKARSGTIPTGGSLEISFVFTVG